MSEEARKRELLKRLLAKRAGTEEAVLPPKPASIPLSKGQQALWYLQRLAPESFAYNVVFAVRIRSELDVGALESAMATLVERHEGLRVQLGDAAGQPMQQLLDLDRPRLEVLEVEGPEALEDRVRTFSMQPFYLEREPPLRVALFRQSGEDPVLVWLFHHIAIDFWSIGLLVQELDLLYLGAYSGQLPALPKLEATYGDFVAWQQRRLQGEFGERLRAFWADRLEGVQEGADLPCDRARTGEVTFRGGTRRCDLDRDLASALRSLAEQFRTTTFTALLSVVLILLAKLSGRRHVLVGTPVAGRSVPAFQPVVGYFVNLLPLSGEVVRGMGFADFVTVLASRVAEALDHEDLPFADIVEGLGRRRDPSQSSFCDVGFALESSKMDRLGIVPLLLGEAGAQTRIGGLVCEGLQVPQQEGQFDLNFHFLEMGGGLAGLAMYNADLLDGVTVERWCAGLESLLRQIVEDPRGSIDALSPLSDAQHHQLTVEWQGADPWVSSTETVVDLFRSQAIRTPEATALETAEARVTYRELDRRTERLACLLRRQGVGPEVIVGVCFESSPELVLAELAILKAGGAYLPLDPTYPDDRKGLMLAESGARALVAGSRAGSFSAEGLWATWSLDELRAEALAAGTAFEASDSPGALPENLAYVIFTSGSTGRPKGVGVPHRGLPSLLRWHQRSLGVGAGDRLPNTAGPGFDPSGLEIWSALTAGATVLFPPRDCRISGRRFARWVEAEGVTVASASTPLAEAFLSESLCEGAKLRSLFLGGDRLGSRPKPSASFRVFNLYGPTEATVVAAGGRVRPAAPGLSAPGLPAPSIGRPIDGVRIHLLDDALLPVPAGAAGELYIGGRGVARGYLGRPALTALGFLPDPFAEEPGQRLYRTGDDARWSSDGRLLFMGRQDHQVKIRGVRIELGEIEGAVRSFPGVAAAVVVDRPASTGGSRLVAYLVVKEAGFDISSLTAHLEGCLPSVMVPSAFMTLDSLPLTSNGKVDRRALPSPPSLEGEGVTAGSPELAGLEAKISAAWTAVLGLSQVPPEANFFDLGGHSLLLGELLGRLEDDLGRSLTVVQLLRYPTVRSLARFLSPSVSKALTGSSFSSLSELKLVPEAKEPIAVIGMSCRFPGARDVDSFWTLLIEGKEGLRRLTDDELSKAPGSLAGERRASFVPVAGDLPGVELFDADLFGLNPREAEILDPQQRLFLECAWEAMEDAGAVPGLGDKTGVFAGVARSSYLDRHLAPNRELVDEIGEYQLSLSNDKDFLPTRVSYLLGLKGPSVNVQTACSTSLTAIHLGCQSLRLGECRQALAGGVAIRLPQAEGYHFQEGMILSPDGHCRAFDARAAGTVGANGVGVVLLKPLSQALADGNPVRAIILGSAMNNDGSLKAGYTAPSVDGQIEALQGAYEAAGVDPGSVHFVEAHGTGTELGDPIEVAALNEVFRGRAEAGSIGLGSVKTNLGHLDAAAGVAGFMKAVLAVEKGAIPPSLHFSQANPQIEFADSPFSVVTDTRPLPRGKEPHRAGVSSFGIGGTNVHVVLQEPPASLETESDARKDRRPSRPELLVLSAQSPAALAAGRSRLAVALASSERAPLRDVAWTLQTGRKDFQQRMAVVVAAGEDGAKALGDSSRRLEGRVETVPSVAFLFPGQGAQHPLMARNLCARSEVFAASLNRCAEILSPHLGEDLHSLLTTPGSEAAAKLRRTAIAQPVLFALELSLAHLWQSLGIDAQGMLGHSIGELVAACLAGVFSEEEGLQLAAARGKLMQALPPGAMLGISLPEKELVTLLPPSLSLAAVNSPEACVVSGPSAEVAELAKSLRDRGIEHRHLHTSHAFHSAMMEPALDAFRRELQDVSLLPPRRPFVSNVTGTWIRPEEATDGEYWVRHLRGTVRFAEGLRSLTSKNLPLLLEVGPGKTLGTFARHTIPGVRALASLPHPKRAGQDEEAFLEAAGRLWLSGLPIRWGGLEDGAGRSLVSLPAYAFQRGKFWIEPPAEKGTRSSISAARRASGEQRRPIEEWLYRPTWIAARPVASDPSSLTDGLWLLFLGQAGLGDQLAERLRFLGLSVVTVPPEDAEDLDQVFEALPEAPRRIVALGAYGHTAESAPEGTEEWVRQGLEESFFRLAALARRVAQEGLEVRIDVVTSGAVRVLPEDRVLPLRAAAFGPARVLPQERRGVTIKVLDLPMPDVEETPSEETTASILAALEAELGTINSLSDGAETAGSEVIAWRRGQRWQRYFEPIGQAEPKKARPGAVVLITGGVGGVGGELARHMATSGPVRLALLSRRDQPPSGLLESLRKAGAEVEIFAGDVTDRSSLAAAIEAVKARFGRIDGVIHGAGIAGGTMLEVLEGDRALEVLAPKVLGSLLLAELLPPRSLDFFLLCSSLSAVLGGIGQASYCAANAVMDALAEALGVEGVTSVAWDLWRDVGMAVETNRGDSASERKRQELGMAASEARGLLDQVLRCGLPRVVVSTVDLEARRRRTLAPMTNEAGEARASPEMEVAPGGGHDRPTLATPFVAPRSEAEERLAEIWSSLLGIRAVGVHDDFFELGGHSLLGTRLVSRVQDRLGAELSLSTLFRLPTVAGLAEEVERQRTNLPGTATASESMEVDLESLDDTAMAALLESLEAAEAAIS